MPLKFRTDQNRLLLIQSRTGTGTTYWTCKWKCQEISRPLFRRQKCAV